MMGTLLILYTQEDQERQFPRKTTVPFLLLITVQVTHDDVLTNFKDVEWSHNAQTTASTITE